MIINRSFKDFKFRHRSKKNQIIFTKKKVKNDEEVLNLIDNFLEEKNSFIFESVEKGKIKGRYTIFGKNPDKIWEFNNNNSYLIQKNKKRKLNDKPDKLIEKINEKHPSKFYLAAGKNDQQLIDEILNSHIGSNCISLNNLKINEMLPIIANCNLYCGNDTGFMHISAALNLKTVALFMDSPVLAYGKYSKNINVIIPEGETEESTTHDTLGADKISFDKVYNKCIELLTN